MCSALPLLSTENAATLSASKLARNAAVFGASAASAGPSDCWDFRPWSCSSSFCFWSWICSRCRYEVSGDWFCSISFARRARFSSASVRLSCSSAAACS